MSDDLEQGEIGWEGWDTDGVDDKHVRRFAKPPFTWVVVRRSRFDRKTRARYDDPTLEETYL